MGSSLKLRATLVKGVAVIHWKTVFPKWVSPDKKAKNLNIHTSFHMKIISLSIIRNDHLILPSSPFAKTQITIPVAYQLSLVTCSPRLLTTGEIWDLGLPEK